MIHVVFTLKFWYGNYRNLPKMTLSCMPRGHMMRSFWSQIVFNAFFSFWLCSVKKNWSVNPKLLVKLIFAKHWVKRAETWQEAFINPSFRNHFLCNGIDLFDSLSDVDASLKNGLLKCRTFNRKETVYVEIA